MSLGYEWDAMKVSQPCYMMGIRDQRNSFYQLYFISSFNPGRCWYWIYWQIGILSMFSCGRILLTRFKHADVKGVGKRFTTTASFDRLSLTTGIVRWQFLALRCTTWQNNGSRFEHHILRLSGEYKHSQGDIKNVMLESCTVYVFAMTRFCI